MGARNNTDASAPNRKCFILIGISFLTSKTSLIIRPPRRRDCVKGFSGVQGIGMRSVSAPFGRRSEVKRGEWQQFQNGSYQIRPMGSVAYKLGLVAAGRADITFTLTPKNEWDVAAGAALVESAGGFVATLDNAPLRCNNRNPLLTGLMASGPFLKDSLLAALAGHLPATAGRRS